MLFALQDVSVDQQRVFQYVANGTTSTYLVPDQMHVLVASDFGIQSFAFSDLSDYVRMEASLMGIEFGVAKYTASLLMNAQVQSIANRMQGTQSHFLLAQEYADMFSVLVDPNSLPLDRTFVQRVQSLPGVYNSASHAAFVEFIEQFGTHTLVEVTFGGRIRYKSFVSVSEANGMSASNAKMHISMGLLRKKFPLPTTNGLDGLSKSKSEVKPFASMGGLSITGGEYTISTSADNPNWFKQWAASVHRAPAVTRRRVEPIMTFMMQINQSVAQAFSDFLTKYSADLYSANLPPTVPQLPVFLTWSAKPLSCYGTDKRFSCPPTAPLARASTYRDSHYDTDYVVASEMAQGYQPTINWVSAVAERVFATQPFESSHTINSNNKRDTKQALDSTQPEPPPPRYRHARLVSPEHKQRTSNAQRSSSIVNIPGLEQLGTGFDSLSGKHRLPVLDWSYTRGTMWRDGVSESDYAIPDHVAVSEQFASQPLKTAVHRSIVEYQQSLAQECGISLWIPGLFSLDHKSYSTQQVFGGAESILGVGSKEYVHYSLTIDNAMLADASALTDAFKQHVQSLPEQYDQQRYFAFVRLYGTHVINSAAYGGAARLWMAINYQLYSTLTVEQLKRGIELHFGLLEAGAHYGTDDTQSSIDFASNSFSWLSLGGGIGSEILTDQWSTWIPSTKVRPIQLSRRLLAIDTLVALLHPAKASNVNKAIGELTAAAQQHQHQQQQRFSVPQDLELLAYTTSKARGLYTGGKLCSWHYLFDDTYYTPTKSSETYSELSWNVPDLPPIQKYFCHTVQGSGLLASCALDSWVATTASGSGGSCSSTLAASPLTCCKLAYVPPE
jgi:hypothetical protein